jgi:hypothetical protein
MRDRMLAANTASIRQVQNRIAPPTETMWDRATRSVGDWFNDKLMIEDTFTDTLQTGLPDAEGGMGRQDRARHLLWASKLAERYGPVAAMAITTAKEGENIFTDPFKALSRLGNNTDSTDSIREHQFDSFKESGRDFKTNLWAVRNAPRNPDGSIRAFTPEEAGEIAGKLGTTTSPLNERVIAETPSGVLPYPDREATTTFYPEPEPQGQIKFGPIKRVPSPEEQEVLDSVPFENPGEHFREVLQPPAIKDRPPGDPKWRGRQAVTSGDGPIGGPAETIEDRIWRMMNRTDI